VDQIEQALEATARPVSGIRYGLVDAYSAMRALGRPAPQLRPLVIGFPGIGSKLTAASGIWSGSGLVVSYRWERCAGGRCDPAGDGPEHVVEAADADKQLRVVATAADVATATSSATAVVLAAPRRERAPSISGRPRVGTTLTGNPGVWSGTNLTFAYTWLRCVKSCWSAKTVGHRLTYAVRAADRGARLKFVVTAANELDTISAPSALTARIR
jgi:hypothetical protein